MIVGIDEVGRGPWAGPLVFGAVVLGGETIEGLTDSKKLTPKKRQAFDSIIREKALSYGLGWVSAEELDEIGMSAACALACRRALDQIDVAYHEIVIDGTINFLKDTGKGPYVTTLKQADLLVPSVSAASIIAKVARDAFMEEQGRLYPEYGFGAHVGYGTQAHRAALERYGVTSLHRKSFAPIAALLEGSTVRYTVQNPSQAPMKTTRKIGDESEDVATEHMKARGYTVLDRNWKKTQCEIDIVAKNNDVIFFVEVKHRQTDRHGGGLGAVTKQKLAQMTFAAKVYLHFHGQDDADWRLGVAITTDTPPRLIDFFVLD